MAQSKFLELPIDTGEFLKMVLSSTQSLSVEALVAHLRQIFGNVGKLFYYLKKDYGQETKYVEMRLVVNR